MGEYNITKFFLFICATALHSIVVCIGSSTALFVNPIEMREWKYTHWLSLVLIIYSGLIGLCLFILVFSQIIFISGGKTTNEFVRKKENDIWDEGCQRNWKNAFHCNDDEDGYLYMNVAGVNVKANQQNQENQQAKKELLENTNGNNGVLNNNENNTQKKNNNVINNEEDKQEKNEENNQENKDINVNNELNEN